MTINDALQLLKSYSGPFELTLHPGANETLINKVESTYGVTLPDDFKTLYRFTDGFEIDEDIFNMIPLEEMIGKKEADKPIWIAEYMIYSEMWGLEINPEIPNQYSISIADSDSEKITLTNSLAEFIGRILKGGVFEKGGLYHWKDEIKAKTHGPTDPNEMKLLFRVFSECLELDLISKQEVIGHADWIVSTEGDPDHFFIDISLCRDLNDLLAVLNSVNLKDDILQVRVILGIIYFKFLINKMTADKALSILIKFAHRVEFTPYETNEMGYLIEEWRYLGRRFNKRAQKKFNDRVKVFFDNYSGLYPYDYKNWNEINSKINNDFLSKKQMRSGFLGKISKRLQKFF